MATNQPVALRPNVFQANQRGQFKELIAGAGSQIFKVNKEGIFAGENNYTGAPLKISYAGVLNLGLTTGSSININGTSGTISLKYNNAVKGTIAGFITASHSEDSYVRLAAQSGRTITLMESMIEINGTLNPYDDIACSIGASGLRWNEVWAKSVIAFGTGSKFSCQGSDGIDAGFDTADGKRANFKGGILYSLS